MPPAGLYKILRIKEIKDEQKDFKVFAFDEQEPIEYKAGQYLTFVHDLNGTEIRRSYSMTSSPGLVEPLSVGVKRIPNGFYSRLLVDHARVGDELITSGAGGVFVLPVEISNFRQLFFFAAGSGITPIYSIIKSALNFHPHLKIVLVYSANSLGSTIFQNELQSLQIKFKDRFSIEWLFSSSPNLSGARLYRESLIQYVKDFSSASFREELFYICGPLSYMRMCTFVLQEMGAPPDNIKKENFLIAQPPPIKSLPPDQRSHEAHIFFAGNQYHVPVHYPDSILLAARKSGINLPYSCETGRCANCIAKRIKGNVWLSHNEVLTEKDLEGGLTLTCVGHPVDGDVQILIG